MITTKYLSDLTEAERDALSDAEYIALYNAENDDDVTTREEAEDAFDYMWYNDDFEVSEFPEKIKAKYPGWYFCKVYNFSLRSLREMDAWLVDNVKFGQYKREGWSSGCSSSVGVCFESGKDAMMFKLRWR